MNEMKLFQASTILKSLVEQATGKAVIAPTNAGEFVSMATTAIKTGYDPILNAMSQMWGKTIFSNRPYSAKFKGMEMDAERWGNATRKLSIIDKPIEDDERFTYPVGYKTGETPPDGDGKSVDMFKQNKPKVQQTWFYGQSVYEKIYTIYKDNLDVAFSSPEEFMRFNEMVVQNNSDVLEQYKENIARGILANYIGALIKEAQNERVVHLLTEYNAQTGLSLTAQTVYQPANFAPFMRWVYARVKSISRLMTERSAMFQTTIGGSIINRHTPADMQKIYLFSPAMEQMTAMVTADTFHDNYLKYADFEAVNFWQSIETPDSISVYATYTNSSGAEVTDDEETEQAGIFGVICDRDAMGYAVVNNWSAVSPLNIRGGYWNNATHANFRTRTDMTEKGVILLLD